MFASRNAALSAAIIALAAGAATAVDYTVTSISPEDYSETFVTAAAGPSQVGYGSGPSTGGNSHAILWSGTAESLIDLNPDGYDGSVIYGVGGGQQVGVGFDLGTNLAILWPAPTAGSAVNLTPAGIDFAAAYGTDGTTQAASPWARGTHSPGRALRSRLLTYIQSATLSRRRASFEAVESLALQLPLRKYTLLRFGRAHPRTPSSVSIQRRASLRRSQRRSRG